LTSGKPRKGPFLVKNIPSPFFRAGEEIPGSGLYRVFHAEHRVSHKAILLGGEQFPRCVECKDDVHFELIEAAPELDTDPNFVSFRSLRLYELPHPSDDKKEESA
jgi:hypothetical protein